MAKFIWLKEAFFSVLIFLFFSASLYAQTFQYDRIEVIGNLRIDTESVIEIANLPSSGSVSASTINQAFRALSDRGVFEEISIVPRDSTLEITVREYPTINQIAFEGNKRINDEELSTLILSKPRQVYLPSRAKEDAGTISLVYYARGRFATDVTPFIIRRSNNRVDLVFEIVEGSVVEIERLSFIGNSAFTDRRLRRVLSSKQASTLRTIVKNDTYFAERLELDKSLLNDFYLANGYVDFEIESVSTELTRERDAFLITFKISEGQQFNYGNITASSALEEIDPTLFLEQSKLSEGQIFSPLTLSDSVERLQFYASEQGLNFIRVTPETKKNQDNSIDVNFKIERGERIIVDRIDIEGNVTTLDRVIRREFRIVEGDPLQPAEISRAAARIRALGLFSDVQVEAREVSPTQVAYTVNVDEALTGSLAFGLGYSPETKLSGNVSLTERNFLGRGQTLGLSFELGSGSRDTNVSFYEPRLFDQNISYEGILGWSSSATDSDVVNVDEFTLYNALGFPLERYSRLTLNVGFSRLSPSTYSGISKILLEDLGKDAIKINRRISFGYAYSFNRIGAGYDRGSGFSGRFSQIIYFGNNSHNTLRTRGELNARYTPLGSEVVYMATLEGGVVRSRSSATRLSDRFQTNTSILRGFAPGGIGPRSIDNESLGGNYFAAMRLESQFPLGFGGDAGIKGGVFLDTGSVWGLDQKVDFKRENTLCLDLIKDGDSCLVDDSFKLRSSIGASLFFNSPFGPLRLNLSRPLLIYKGDQKLNFEFTLSSSF